MKKMTFLKINCSLFLGAVMAVSAQAQQSNVLTCTVKEANKKARYQKDSSFDIPLSAFVIDGNGKDLIYKNVGQDEYLRVSRETGDFLFLWGQFNRIESENNQGVMEGNCVQKDATKKP